MGLRVALWALLLAPLPFSASADEGGLAAGLEALASKSFKRKTAAIQQIAGSGAEAAPKILQALLDGRLYRRKSDAQIVLLHQRAGENVLSDPATGAELGAADKSRLKKVIINNKMRGILRSEIARLSLYAPAAADRRRAVKSLLGSLSPDTVALLRQVLVQERDAGVQDTIHVALALADLEASDAESQLAAIRALSGSLHSEVRIRLAELVDRDPATGDETQAAIHAAAVDALRAIDQKRRWFGFVETVFFGLSLGFVLVLAATGLAITFGVMGVINMAHGELIMLGAYSTWLVQQWLPDQLELSLLAAVPVAFCVSALAGVAIERGVVRFLYGRPLETLLATFGVSLVLQQAVRTLFSPLNRAVATPEWMSGQWVINDALALTYNRLYIIVFAAGVFAVLVAILQYTPLGLQIRAVAQNRDMARSMGVRGGFVDAATFGLGSGVAGLAGVALSQLTNVGPNLGQAHIVDSFMVVVFGGVGNLWGTLVAGLSLGVANKFLEPFAGAVLAKILVLVCIILFIQRRPRGLFPQQGRAAEG
ncbi:MAG: urea ABC transporter permease subunit UrtB [Proteobacteria bacterium]|nr:urea ABC transporter permease subunit UrtB [Pseudomonadota bacterium]